ncbi:MAG: DUF6273 domain-containing protein [Firmicutes bacterium]|nr:DUF6273 domain-containing protein [Bacillota bacterium]
MKKCKNCGGILTSPKGVTLQICPFCQTDNNTPTKSTTGEEHLRDAFLQDSSIYKDKWRLKGLINDRFAAEDKLRKRLRIAVDENIAAKIIKMLPESVNEQKIRIANIATYFADEYDWSVAQGAEYVRILAFGANVNAEVLAVLANLAKAPPAAVNNPPPACQTGRSPKAMALTTPLKIGDIITFSNYKWRILDVQNNQALLLSDLVLEKQAYNKKNTDITWETCTLRKYLNNDFYNKLPYKSQIAKKIIVNNNNPRWGTKGGNKTTDHIFLLSLEEIAQYLGNKYTTMAKLKMQGYVDDSNNNKRVTKNTAGATSWWWLRSPGYSIYDAARVNNSGSIGIDRRNVSVVGGVRPALWLNI